MLCIIYDEGNAIINQNEIILHLPECLKLEKPVVPTVGEHVGQRNYPMLLARRGSGLTTWQ